MNAQELLERLNLLDENECIEAKQASEVGKSVLETVCAFTNEPGLGGGWILLGVIREELALFPAYEAQGIENRIRLVRTWQARLQVCSISRYGLKSKRKPFMISPL